MIRVGIAGCGSIARQRHAHECRLNPDVEIAGFFDLIPQRRDSMVKDFGGVAYDTFEAMIADAGVDAVVVCVANAQHAPCTISALKAGKHVLCEKPMAIALKDCEAMLDAARRSGKRLCIGQNQRLSPAHARAKRILDSGELGRVISFQTTFGHQGPEMWSADKSANTWFFKKDAAAFGSMADLGVHKIDLMRYLLDDEVASVLAKLTTLDKKFPDGSLIEVDDNAIMTLAFAGGALGTVTTSWTHYGEECNATVLYCEKGIMRLYADPKYTLEITYSDGAKAHYELDAMQTNNDVQQSSSGVIDTFAEGLLTGGATVLDADKVIGSMRVVFACLEASAAGREVKLG